MYQTVDNAYGFTVDLIGTTSLRRNDLTLLRLSNINDRMAELQEDSEDQVMTFGDSAYKRRSHTTSYYAELEERLARWNRRMKRVKKSIEWNNGTTAAMFNYVCQKRKLKVLQSSNVSKVYTVATILRNLHIGLYGF
jgi:transposase-like protein